MHEIIRKLRDPVPVQSRPPFECIALLLQGGGALGAYQAGVYQALSEANVALDWVAGISIGAINSAITAGNPPEQRVSKLRAFWEAITVNPLFDWAVAIEQFALKGDIARGAFNQMSAAWALLAGAPGFFALRQPSPWLHPALTAHHTRTPIPTRRNSLGTTSTGLSKAVSGTTCRRKLRRLSPKQFLISPRSDQHPPH